MLSATEMRACKQAFAGMESFVTYRKNGREPR
jgi:hypothetical protein